MDSRVLLVSVTKLVKNLLPETELANQKAMEY